MTHIPRLASLSVILLSTFAYTQVEQHAQTIKLSAPATAVALSPRAKFAATVSTDKKLSAWNLADGQSTKPVALGSSQVDSIAVSPSGRMVFVCAHDGTAAVWDMDTGQPLQQWRLPHYAAASGFSGDGKFLAIAPGGEPVQIFEVEGFQKLGQTLPITGGVQALAFSHDGTLLATADSDGGIRVYTTRHTTLLSENHDLLMEPLAVDFTADGEQVLAAGGDRVVAFVDARSGKLKRRLPRTEHPVYFSGLKVSPDGSRFALVFMKAEDMTEPAPVAIWEVVSGKRQTERTMPLLLGGAEWTVDGALLCFGGHGDTVQFWRMP